jgi:predicted amidophosphoribosyltransferase
MLICKYCFRIFDPLHVWHFLQRPLLCRICYQQIEWHHRIERWQGIQIESLFDYGPVFQKMIYQFKSNLDVELGSVFLNQHNTYLKLKYFQYTFVLAPSHDDDLIKRGFHPLVEIFKAVGLPLLILFEKNRPYRQSEQQGRDRQGIQQVTILKKSISIPQRICLVDDVMTTGETLKAMIGLLKPISFKHVKILVLARKKPEKIEITRHAKNDKIRNWKQDIWHG